MAENRTYNKEVWELWNEKTDKDIDRILESDYSESNYESCYCGVAATTDKLPIFGRKKKTIEY